MALSNMLTEADVDKAVRRASAPVMAYQNDAYENAEEQYYADQVARERAGLAGKEATDFTKFMPRDQFEQQQQPPVQPTAPIQPQPLSQMVQEQPVNTLSPCQMGMCQGYGGVNVDGVPVLAQDMGKGIMSVSGVAPNGRNRLGQKLVAGELASLGATTETIEKANKAQELYNIEAMRRTPEWNENYRNLLPQYKDNPRLAGAQSDFVTGNSVGGQTASEVNRYLAPLTYDALNQEEQRNAVLAMAIPEYANVLANRPEIEGGLRPQAQITGYKNNEDGTNQFDVLMGGQQISTGAVSPDGTPLTANALFNSGMGLDAFSAGVSQLQNQRFKQEQLNNTAQNNANNFAIKQAQLQAQAQQRGNKQALDVLKLQQQLLKGGTGSGSGGSSSANKQTFGNVPQNYTAKGMVDHFTQINALEDAQNVLTYGAGAVKKANDPKSTTSINSNKKDAVPKRQTGFATNGRVSEQLINTVAKSSPENASRLRNFNNGFGLLQDQAIWQDPQRGISAYAQLGQALKDGALFQQRWAQSSRPESIITAQEMQRSMNYMSEARALLGRYIDAYNLEEYNKNLINQQLQQIQQFQFGLGDDSVGMDTE